MLYSKALLCSPSYTRPPESLSIQTSVSEGSPFPERKQLCLLNFKFFLTAGLFLETFQGYQSNHELRVREIRSSESSDQPGLDEMLGEERE